MNGVISNGFAPRSFSTVGSVVSLNCVLQLGHQASTSLVLPEASLSMVASEKRPEVATSPVRICTTPQQWVGPPITLYVMPSRSMTSSASSAMCGVLRTLQPV